MNRRAAALAVLLLALVEARAAEPAPPVTSTRRPAVRREASGTAAEPTPS